MLIEIAFFINFKYFKLKLASKLKEALTYLKKNL